MLEAFHYPQLRTFHYPQIFTSLHANSLKLMTLIHALVSSHICRALRSISRAKSFLLDVLRDGGHLVYCGGRRRNGKRNVDYYGSFRLHYNWCSSRSFSIPNSVAIRTNDSATEGDGSTGLSGYIRWLEERKPTGEKAPTGGGSEIDEMAEVFIAMCREKFVLEKQESERRFQEMLARSM